MTDHISKSDAARRQLVTAIQLFFSQRDLISVISLAANAWEIIDCLCRKRGVQSMSEQSRQYIPTGKRLKVDYINSPYRNFFKHADTDANETLPPIAPSFVDGLIFLAVEDYLRLHGKAPVEFQVFQVWYLAIYIDKVDSGSMHKISNVVNECFPIIRALRRDEQINMGSKVLNDALANKDLLASPQTEYL